MGTFLAVRREPKRAGTFILLAASLTGFSQELMKHGVDAVVVQDFGHIDGQRLWEKKQADIRMGRRGGGSTQLEIG